MNRENSLLEIKKSFIRGLECIVVSLVLAIFLSRYEFARIVFSFIFELGVLIIICALIKFVKFTIFENKHCKHCKYYKENGCEYNARRNNGCSIEKKL